MFIMMKNSTYPQRRSDSKENGIISAIIFFRKHLQMHPEV